MGTRIQFFDDATTWEIWGKSFEEQSASELSYRSGEQRVHRLCEWVHYGEARPGKSVLQIFGEQKAAACPQRSQTHAVWV